MEQLRGFGLIAKWHWMTAGLDSVYRGTRADGGDGSIYAMRSVPSLLSQDVPLRPRLLTAEVRGVLLRRCSLQSMGAETVGAMLVLFVWRKTWVRKVLPARRSPPRVDIVVGCPQSVPGRLQDDSWSGSDGPRESALADSVPVNVAARSWNRCCPRVVVNFLAIIHGPVLLIG